MGGSKLLDACKSRRWRRPSVSITLTVRQRSGAATAYHNKRIKDEYQKGSAFDIAVDYQTEDQNLFKWQNKGESPSPTPPGTRTGTYLFSPGNRS
jgi:hypothetical protein